MSITYGLSILLMLSTFCCFCWLIFGYFIRRERTHVSEDMPEIEVLLPCHNEEKYVNELFIALEHLQWKGSNLRFCAIDDRSSDQTKELLATFVWRDLKNRRLLAIHPSEAIPYASPKKNALEQAIFSSKAEWVVTLDADSRPQSDWLLEMFAGWEKNWIAIVPSYTFSGGLGLGSKIRKLEALVQSFLMRSAIRNKHPLSAIGAGFAYQVAAFHQVGGYRGTIGERISGDDDLLLHRLAKLPGRIVSKNGRASMAVLDRETGSYWRARGRHYSVAPDYPFFWKLFGVLAIPGIMIAPMFLFLDAFVFQRWYAAGVAVLLLLLEVNVLSKVAKTTNGQMIWWYPFFLFFGFPFWLLGIVWSTVRRKPGW
ncbi:MAG: glycosyltransferase [bacterium]|nr:glycosyltransferase [bacterium]